MEPEGSFPQLQAPTTRPFPTQNQVPNLKSFFHVPKDLWSVP